MGSPFLGKRDQKKPGGGGKQYIIQHKQKEIFAFIVF